MDVCASVWKKKTTTKIPGTMATKPAAKSPAPVSLTSRVNKNATNAVLDEKNGANSTQTFRVTIVTLK